MKKPLSFSAIKTYTECGTRYKLRYVQNMRGRYFHAALAFGSAIDKGLNELLLTKNIDKAIAEFDKLWNFQYVNGMAVSLPEYTELVYAETDFDHELLHKEDIETLNQIAVAFELDQNPFIELYYKQVYQSILEKKKDKGWDNLNSSDKKFFNYCNWHSLKRKGHIMISSYDKKVMPNIKEVLVVQKENYLENNAGDKVVQYLDLIVKWKDGRHILFDNKTSARDYEENSASLSPQLISYYHGVKEEYNLNAVGFIVLKKTILKNKIKLCTVCQSDGSGAKHKTCNETNNSTGRRCNGEWDITINPECYIQVIINNVTDRAEDLVLSAFDEAQQGIKNKVFHKNLSACKQGPIQCEFYRHCWYGDDSEVIVVPPKAVP